MSFNFHANIAKQTLYFTPLNWFTTTLFTSWRIHLFSVNIVQVTCNQTYTVVRQRLKWRNQESGKCWISDSIISWADYWSIHSYRGVDLASFIHQRWKGKCCWGFINMNGWGSLINPVPFQENQLDDTAPVKKRPSWTGLKLTLLWSVFWDSSSGITEWKPWLWWQIILYVFEYNFPFVLQVHFYSALGLKSAAYAKLCIFCTHLEMLHFSF